jgi:hypothetical protein
MDIRKSSRGCLSSVLIGLAAIPIIAFATNDNGTLTVGKQSSHLPPPVNIWACTSGYEPTVPLGSYSPTGLTGGETVSLLTDLDTGTTSACSNLAKSSFLHVSGFSIDPGQAWITSVTCNGIEKTGISASSYSYSSGTAIWTWNGSDFGLISKSSGTNVSCTISHN